MGDFFMNASNFDAGFMPVEPSFFLRAIVCCTFASFCSYGRKNWFGLPFVPSSKMAKSFSPKSIPIASFLAGTDRK
jgi:hypothetical protein